MLREEKIFKNSQDVLKKKRKQVTLIIVGWTKRRTKIILNKTILNFLVDCSKEAIFLNYINVCHVKVVDKIYKMFVKVVDKIYKTLDDIIKKLMKKMFSKYNEEKEQVQSKYVISLLLNNIESLI